MSLIRAARIRTVLSLGLLALAVAGCGTLDVGMVRTPGAAAPTGAIETREVTPAAQQPTEVVAVPDPTQVAPARTPVPPPSTLHVAFAKESNVWLWVEGQEAAQLTRRGGVEQIKLSDDGAVVAFTRGGELWMVRADGTDERPLVSIDDLEAIQLAMSVKNEVLLHSFAWVPATHTLAFNTREDAEIGLVPNDDLRVVDADTGEQELLLVPGDGGEFTHSLDGLQIAVVSPGSISLVDADGRNRRDAFTYTPVSTASEFRYYASPTWAADSSFLRVAIPPANPFSDPPQPATVWHIPADGSGPGLLTEIEMAGPSHAYFSPDLRFIAHQVGQPSGHGEVGASLLSS